MQFEIKPQRGIAHPRTLLILLAFVLGACTDEPRGGPRLKTYPVTGVVTVDGQPAAYLTIECHPGPDSAIQYHVATMTDEKGHFEIATYESGDGLPEGTYRLAFLWIEPGIGRVDRLKGAYSDPKKSEYTVTVTKGEPNDLGTIELSSRKS